MKKGTAILAFAFAIAYAAAFSIGMECLLNLWGVSFAIALDGESAVKQYPRFLPFCTVVGLLAFLAIVILFIFHIKASERFAFTKKIRCVQIVSAFVISIPMMKLWEMLFDFLQKAF